MPKVKTHTGAKKRFKVTASGLFKHKRTGLRHILTKKATKRKRGLNVDSIVGPSNHEQVRAMLKTRRGRGPIQYVLVDFAELQALEAELSSNGQAN